MIAPLIALAMAAATSGQFHTPGIEAGPDKALPRAPWVQTDACTVFYLRGAENAPAKDTATALHLGYWLSGSAWWMAHNGATSEAILEHLKVLQRRALATPPDEAVRETCTKLELNF
jgi:hypothetical protein